MVPNTPFSLLERKGLLRGEERPILDKVRIRPKILFVQKDPVPTDVSLFCYTCLDGKRKKRNRRKSY